jgi:hypothetical protein
VSATLEAGLHCAPGASLAHFHNDTTISNYRGTLVTVFSLIPLGRYEDCTIGAASKELRAVYLAKFSRQIRNYWLDFSQRTDCLPETLALSTARDGILGTSNRKARG